MTATPTMMMMMTTGAKTSRGQAVCGATRQPRGPRWRGCATIIVLALAAPLVHCHPHPEASSVSAALPAAKPVEPLHEGPLTDYVPAAGLRWLVLVRPNELAREESLMRSLARLFPKERLDAYAHASGVDLRELPTALGAGFDYGMLFLADSRGNERTVIERFERRLAGRGQLRRPHPRIHVLEGVIQETPRALICIDERLVGMAVGDPTLARIVEAYARRKLESPSALAGASLSTLPRDLGTAPLQLYVPGPLEDRWRTGVGGILGLSTGLGITARPQGDDALELRLAIAGEWGDRDPAPETLLLAFWRELVESPLGRTLALDQPASEPVAAVSAGILELRTSLQLSPFMDGLYAAVAADARELLRLPVGPGHSGGAP